MRWQKHFSFKASFALAYSSGCEPVRIKYPFLYVTLPGMKEPRLQVTAQSLWLPERETAYRGKRKYKSSSVLSFSRAPWLYWSEPFTEHGKRNLWLTFFFVKQPPRLNSLITEKEEGHASSKFNTYTNNHLLVYLAGHLKTKSINSVSYMTVRAGIIKEVRQTNTC